MATNGTSQPTLRILCFGDSLTSGYYQFGMMEHPYSERLEERLMEAFPGRKMKITTDGVPGDVVSFPRFNKRLRDQCKKRDFDWVVILGGTNDLGFGGFQQEIFPKLQEAWNIPLANETSHVLALTVPPLRTGGSARLDRNRQDLNGKILDHRQENFYTLDIKTQMDLIFIADKADSGSYWDDNVHFSPKGYDWIGDRVADRLISLINAQDGKTDDEIPDKQQDQQHQEQQQQQPSSPLRKRRKVPRASDNLDFEEELGDHKRISEGYVIVRRKDLD